MAQTGAQRRIPQEIRPREHHPAEAPGVAPLVCFNEVATALPIAQLTEQRLINRQAVGTVVLYGAAFCE
eukprot:1730721-Prymnesium_polylepis.1